MLSIVGKSFVVSSFVVGIVVTDPSVAALGDTVVHVVDAVKIRFITLVLLKARHLSGSGTIGRFCLSRQRMQGKKIRVTGDKASEGD